MKRLFLIGINLITVLSLCSCQINWFGEQIYVKWWFNLIWILSVLIVSLLITLFIISSHYRVCPHCKHKFKPKWYSAFAAIFVSEKDGSSDSRLFKCPCCKEKHLMPKSYNQKDE